MIPAHGFLPKLANIAAPIAGVNNIPASDAILEFIPTKTIWTLNQLETLE